MAGNKSGLELRGLRKSYDAQEVIQGVDVTVEDGEYLVLVGPSGCGKSTLLRCIAGLEELSGGELWIGGARADGMAPGDRDVAMVFQNYALYPHMTVRQNMGFALKVQGQPEEAREAKVQAAAELLGLTELLERRPAELSGGQRQRVAMGRAIVREPSVFLFDEPLSNLDASLRQHMRVELKRLHRQLGATIVHVTHDQVEALTLADRILVLDQGVVQQIGTPRVLFEQPANTFVAQFIGSPSMALLSAEGHGEFSSLEGVDGQLPVPAEGPYVWGVRPTDVELGEPQNGGLTAVVDVIESQGATALVHLQLGPHALTAQVPEPTTVATGDEVGLVFRAVHRFDATTGERL